VWSINDNGDVPPAWLLTGPKTAIQGRRFTFNAKAKEVIIGGDTAVRTYSFPEIF
jgi:hypothetical protein